MWYTCVQCGKKFELSEAEKDFYEEKNLSLPKRCKECRKRNRIEKNEAVVPRGKERRKRRKNALRQVPVTTLILLIALTFVYISFVRKPESSTPKQTKLTQVTENPNSSIQKAVLFQSDEKLKEHYEKHGKAMGFASAEEYLAAANAAKMREMHDKLTEQLKQVEERKAAIRAKAAMVKSQQKANEIKSDLGGSSLAAFDALEEKLNRKLDEAEAAAELNTKKDDMADLMAKYDDAATVQDSGVEDELAALKAKLGK